MNQVSLIFRFRTLFGSYPMSVIFILSYWKLPFRAAFWIVQIYKISALGELRRATGGRVVVDFARLENTLSVGSAVFSAGLRPSSFPNKTSVLLGFFFWSKGRKKAALPSGFLDRADI